MKFILFLSIISTLTFQHLSAQQDKPAYVIYNTKGEQVNYAQMIEYIAGKEAFFFGEYHNNPISHWLELEVTKSLYEKNKGNIILGAEMFEADTQLILTEYVEGTINTTRFEEDTRLWPNYATDYEPLVEFARENKLPFIATNIPRRYADIVHKTGSEEVLYSLSDEAKKYIAPLPVSFKPDSIMLGESSIMSMMSQNPLALAKSQALKDATMAFFIEKNLQENKLFIHYNGSYHTNSKDGIIYFLLKHQPTLKIATLTTVQQEEIETLDEAYRGLADFILCVPETMTRTY